MKVATVYQRKGSLYLHASSRTTDGVWMASAPFLCVAPASSAGEIATAVRQSVACSSEDVPHPSRWDGLLQPLYALAGVKTWSGFVKGAACGNVEADEDDWCLVPYKNGGSRGG